MEVLRMEYTCKCGTIRTLDEEGYRVLKPDGKPCKACILWVKNR